MNHLNPFKYNVYLCNGCSFWHLKDAISEALLAVAHPIFLFIVDKHRRMKRKYKKVDFRPICIGNKSSYLFMMENKKGKRKKSSDLYFPPHFKKGKYVKKNVI